MKTSSSTWIGWACVANVCLAACRDDRAANSVKSDSGADAATDRGARGSRDAAIDGGGAHCETRCAPDQSLSSTDCICESAGVRMRIAPLSEGFFAQPWPLATRLRADGTLDLDGFPAPFAALFVVLNLPTIAS